jgi:phage portal protein BeeE
MLLGIPGDNTYTNYREANTAFWRATVLPLAAKIAGALGAWLTPAFGGGSPDQVGGRSGASGHFDRPT